MTPPTRAAYELHEGLNSFQFLILLKQHQFGSVYKKEIQLVTQIPSYGHTPWHQASAAYARSSLQVQFLMLAQHLIVVPPPGNWGPCKGQGLLGTIPSAGAETR